MKIKVLGSGCSNCKKLFEITKKATDKLALDCDVEYVTDVQEIIKLGLMQSPVLVINDKPAMVGSTSDITKIIDIIRKNI